MITAIIILLAMFFSTLFVYIVKTWKKYKSNPNEVKQALKKEFGIDIPKPEPSQAKKFAASNNRKVTPGRRWQYIGSLWGAKRIYHHANA